MPHQVNSELIKKYLDGITSPEENLVLEQWHATLLMQKKTYAPIPELTDLQAASWQNLLEYIEQPKQRTVKMNTTWLRYAAAIIIIVGISTYLYVNKEHPSVTHTNPVPVQNDVLPGGNKATLILADGTKIILDSAANGTIALQGSSTITKKENNQVVYSQRFAPSSAPAAILLNTIATPRGGQYKVALPDGSQVWLNAASSITYPTTFSTSERKVSITGEAYFEVTKNKKPFIVDLGTATIEVLGTHFNVNTYKEEPSYNTTLIEGRVRIKTVLTSLTLKPGQQGQLAGSGLSLADHPNLEQVMAWKNGLFNFNQLSLQEVLRQIARWYDVEVVYEGTVPSTKFGGEIQRDLTLSEVLEGFKETGFHFSIEGKKLIVHSK